MSLRGRDIISIADCTREDLLSVLRAARLAEEGQLPTFRERKVLAVLFFEPSTRTRLSFEAAMLRLGGSVLGFSDTSITSLKKGESFVDTIRMVEKYADVIVIRHPWEGSARLAAEAAAPPVINGGDGANQHPTQTFLDLFAIKKTHPSFATDSAEPLSVCFLGDLKYGRTVHSLALALSHFPCRLVFVAPPGLEMPRHLRDTLVERKVPFTEAERVEEFVHQLDILYVTRLQQERFPDPIEFERVRGAYVIHPGLLRGVKRTLRILHPLPRVGEITPEVDDTSHAYYFQQAALGVPVRQAVLALVLGLI